MSTPAPTPTVDPTATATAKASSYYVAFWTKGKISSNPACACDQIMTGEEPRLTKSVAAARHLRGIEAAGVVKHRRRSVAAPKLSAKPATASLRSGELHQINGIDKKGRKVYRPVGGVITVSR